MGRKFRAELLRFNQGRRYWSRVRFRRLNVKHRNQQPVTALGDSLDHLRVFGIVREDLSQFGNGSSEHIVGDEGIRPNPAHQLFFRDNVTAPRPGRPAPA